VVTPVYNGAKYLAECIESVLAQTYSNWEYLIVNNCSTDESLEIAQKYASRDPRIRVSSNSQFLGRIENENNALRQIATDSKYCKVVHADDWIFPECLARMVDVAEQNPTVAMVSAYRLEDERVSLDGLPFPSVKTSGAEICRRTLLGQIYVFGAPTSLLHRADIVRSQQSFYDASNDHGDLEACYRYLRHADFGFVHQVLTFTRRHNEAATGFSKRINTFVLGNLYCLMKYGPVYLTHDEYARAMRITMRGYYEFLASSAVRNKGNEFWEYHKKGLDKLGMRIDRFRIARVLARRVVRHALNPGSTAEIIYRSLRRSPPTTTVPPTPGAGEPQSRSAEVHQVREAVRP
jgi:glycosyltransferase involved in cell wall biosynthesis